MTKHRAQSFRTYAAIWEVVKKIPKGKVATYGEIARVNGLSGQARLVGYALHNLPRNSNVPWHRVVNAQGKISFPKNHTHYRKQRNLLEKEGVLFSAQKIDLKKYGWLRNLLKY